MVHRQSPSMASFRGYVSGGARALIDKIDDSTLMQSMTGQGMKGEGFKGSKDGSYKGPEAPQNYGFTSIVAEATKLKDGQINQCAEGFMSFLGGSRSLPVCGMMDDRRHRLKNLGKDAAKGSAAMYGLKEWGQQILNTEAGQFITGNLEKKNRMQLVENKNGKKQQQQGGGGSGGGGGGSARTIPAPSVFRSSSGVEFEIENFIPEPGVEPRATNGGGSGGDGAGGGQQGQQGQGLSKPTGQKTLHKEDTEVYVEQNGTDTTSRHGEAYSSQKSGSDATMHWEKDKKISHQVTEEHTHIRYKDIAWVWNNKEGNFMFPPLIVKKDTYCKEG